MQDFNLTNTVKKVERYFKLLEEIGQSPPMFELDSKSGVLDANTWTKLFSGFADKLLNGTSNVYDPEYVSKLKNICISKSFAIKL